MFKLILLVWCCFHDVCCRKDMTSSYSLLSKGLTCLVWASLCVKDWSFVFNIVCLLVCMSGLTWLIWILGHLLRINSIRGCWGSVVNISHGNMLDYPLLLLLNPKVWFVVPKNDLVLFVSWLLVCSVDILL